MRLTRSLIALAALAVLVPGALPAQAATKSVRYEVSSFAFTDSEADPVGVTEDGQIDVGGVSFAALAPNAGNGQTFNPRLTAKDDLDVLGTGLVYISSCQDVNQDDRCAPADGDIRAADCVSAGSESVTLFGARKNLPISVFVYAVQLCPNGTQQGSATTGVVTMTY